GCNAPCSDTQVYLRPEGCVRPGGDVYSLARVLYETALGKSQEQFPELPTRLRDFADAAGLMRLNNLILKACESQAARRFNSAAEFRAALADLRQQLASPSPRLGDRGTHT